MSRGPVTLWWSRLEQAEEAWLSLLDPLERDRHDAYRRPEDRARFLLGAVTVRSVYAAALGVPRQAVPVDRTCPDCGRPHGRVRLGPGADRAGGPGGAPEVSVSHAGDRVVVAVNPDGPVGVDVEVVDPALDHVAVARAGLDERAAEHLIGLPISERAWAFTGLWVRMEAAVKAAGAAGIPADSPRILVRDVAVDAAHRAAVAVLDAPPLPFLERDARAILPTATAPLRPPPEP